MSKQKKDKSAEQKILDAARNVFISKGMYGARMQDIADEAGINKALLHYYFKNKEMLFETIFMEASSQLFPKLNQIFSSDEELFVKIEQFCEEYITVMSANPYLPLFVLNEINQDPIYFMKKIWKGDQKPDPAKFLKQIETEVKKGKINPVSPVQLLMNLVSLTIFPFVGKPMFQVNMGLDELQYRQIMEERKKEIPRFIIDSIRK